MTRSVDELQVLQSTGSMGEVMRKHVAARGYTAVLAKHWALGSAGAQEMAAGALKNLANNADNQVAIAAAGGIAPLVTLLKEGSPSAQESAAVGARDSSPHDDAAPPCRLADDSQYHSCGNGRRAPGRRCAQ